jgi:hypothetical protein
MYHRDELWRGGAAEGISTERENEGLVVPDTIFTLCLTS